MASRPVENCPKCGGENISPVDADYYDPEEADDDKFEEWLCEDCGYTWDVQEEAEEGAEGFEGAEDEEE
jgi:predicted nucleic-acid-binding Zn-ribbon protein